MLLTCKLCRLVSSLCVVLFLQSVIVTLWAQSMIVVMAQDFVSVRRERQGLSVMSVCRGIPGTPAVNVSNFRELPSFCCSMADSACPGQCVQLLRAEKDPNC